MDMAVVEDVVLKSIKKVIAKSEKHKTISMNTNIADLGINDIDFIKIIVETESALGIDLDDNDFDYKELSSIQKIIEYVYEFANRNQESIGLY